MKLNTEDIKILKFFKTNQNKKICSLDNISHALNVSTDNIIKLIKLGYLTNDIKNNEFVNDYYLTNKGKNYISIIK